MTYKGSIDVLAKELAEAKAELARLASELAAEQANCRALAQVRDELAAALQKINRITTEWDANKLGAIQIQRKRWQRCGEIAREALERK